MVTRYLTASPGSSGRRARKPWRACARPPKCGASELHPRQNHGADRRLPERTPLNARITGTIERDGYRIDKLIFESQPRYYVTANLFVPPGPNRVSGGVGVAAKRGRQGGAHLPARLDRLAKRASCAGYDPPGQGERLEFYDRKRRNPSSAWAPGSTPPPAACAC